MAGKARATGRIRVLTLAAVVLAATTGALPNQSPNAHAAPLAAGSDFTITSAISSSATSADQPALLHLGVTRYLWYTVSNPLSAPITVTALGIEHVDAPAACPTANLDLGDPSFAGAFVVPAGSSLTVPAPKPITLIDLPDVNQDACKNVTFTFTFTGTGWYSDTTPPPNPNPNPNPNPSTNPAGKVGTATLLATTPNPAAVGTPVTVTARVLPATGSGSATTGSATGTASLSSAAPTGIVTFYLTTATGIEIRPGHRDARPRRLGQPPPHVPTARLRRPARGLRRHGHFAGSTSPAATVSIIAPPAQCTATYTTSIIATPDSPVIAGTKGNDFIYAVGANYRIKAGKGNDCVVVGDGNNTISDGSGADVVIAGNGRNTITMYGSRNVVVVGNGDGNRVTVKGTKKGTKLRRTSGNLVTIGDGSANRVTVGKGSRNVVTLGDGAGNRVTVRKGSSTNRITVGDGAGNRVLVRKGSANVITIGDGAKNRITVTGSKIRVTVGNGTANRIKVGKGTKNRITVGNGARNYITTKGSKNKVILGKGKKNRVVVRKGAGARTTCYLPTPPRSWRGTPVRYYRDTLIRCRVVTR